MSNYILNLFTRQQSGFRQYTTKVKEKLGTIKHEKLIKTAIIGVPNAGKSTFINNLIHHRICPTSNKVHTTRNWSKAICTRNNTQIILFDTPGLVTDKEMKKHQLESSFHSSWRHSIQHSSLIGVIHDISNRWNRHELHPTVLNCLRTYPSVPSFLVLNKIDAIKSKRILLDLVKSLTNNTINLKGKSMPPSTTTSSNNDVPKVDTNTSGWSKFSEVFMVSSVTGDGLDRVLDFVISKAVAAPWEHKNDEFTNVPPETLIIESVRARLLDYLPQEIPYLLKSAMDYYSFDNGKIYASVLVSCPNERIERLVCGESNGKLKQITERISSDLVETFGVAVSLTVATNISKPV